MTIGCIRAVWTCETVEGGGDVDSVSPEHQRRLVLIAGSGRSGTSLMSTALKTLDAVVPQPEVPANDTNPKGFGEPQWLVDFHNEHLRKVDVMLTDARPSSIHRALIAESTAGAFDTALAWLNKYVDDAGVVVLKDPRLTWFIDMWVELGEIAGAQPRLIRMVREPLAVVTSKLRWYANNRTPDFLLGGWIIANQVVDESSTRVRVESVEHHALVQDPVNEVARVLDRLDLGDLLQITPGSATAIYGLMDRDRTHSDPSALSYCDGCSPQLVEIANEIHRSLCDEISGTTDGVAALNDRRDLYARYEEMYSAAERLSHHSQQIEIERHQRALHNRSVQLREVSDLLATAAAQIGSLEQDIQRSEKRNDALKTNLNRSRERQDALRQRVRALEQARLGFRIRRWSSARRQRLLRLLRRLSPKLYGLLRRSFRYVRPKRHDR